MSCKHIDEKMFNYTMERISGKWKLSILFWLAKDGVIRYSEMKWNLKNITHEIVEYKTQGIGAGQPHQSERISTSAAKSGVQFDGTWAFIDTSLRPNLSMRKRARSRKTVVLKICYKKQKNTHTDHCTDVRIFAL